MLHVRTDGSLWTAPATEPAAGPAGVPAARPWDDDATGPWDDDRAARLLAGLSAALAPGSGPEELARAVAAESVLDALDDEQVQDALAALILALHRCGLVCEGLRVQARLDEVDPVVPVGRRAAQSAELAVELAAEALAPARRPPHQPDLDALRAAVTRIRHAAALADRGADPGPAARVAEDAAVLSSLLAAAVADPRQALDRLDDCRGVLRRGPADPVRNLWAAGRVRALLRLPRFGDALVEGHRLLAEVDTGEYRADRLALAYEVVRAEEAAAGTPVPGLRTCLTLAEARAERDAQRLAELFRARVAVLRCADERRALARTARLDALTGLVNRRGAAAAVAAAAGRPDPVQLALLLVDLDGLGRVNDRYGHLAGDVVLQRAAAGLRLLTRPQDVVARWNGDEFAVLAPLEEGEAVALADRIRASVRSGCGPTAQEPVTASVGVAVRSVPVDEADWLRRAELARHTAWRGGGDATVLA